MKKRYIYLFCVLLIIGNCAVHIYYNSVLTKKIERASQNVPFKMDFDVFVNKLVYDLKTGAVTIDVTIKNISEKDLFVSKHINLDSCVIVSFSDQKEGYNFILFPTRLYENVKINTEDSGEKLYLTTYVVDAPYSYLNAFLAKGDELNVTRELEDNYFLMGIYRQNEQFYLDSNYNKYPSIDNLKSKEILVLYISMAGCGFSQAPLTKIYSFQYIESFKVEKNDNYIVFTNKTTL